MCASVRTFLGSHFDGTKAPHRKAEPSATTFTIPLIASLLFVREEITSAIVSEQRQKISAFNIYMIPFTDKIVSFKRIMPNKLKSSHMTRT